MRAVIIPARGGSKRIRRKNIASFLGKPIIQYSIETVIRAEIYDEIIISTDDQEISDLASSLGIITLPDRPSYLSGDNCSIIDVAKYEIRKNNLKDFLSVTVLFACAPLVTPCDLVKATEEFEQQQHCSSLMTVAEYPVPTEWALTIESKEAVFEQPVRLKESAADLITRYYDAGQFYIYHPGKFLTSNSGLVTQGIMPFIIPREQAVDIDTVADWQFAERLYWAQTQFKR